MKKRASKNIIHAIIFTLDDKAIMSSKEITPTVNIIKDILITKNINVKNDIHK